MSVIVVGNSSSGIKEAIAFKCPVINIGSRQNGRLKPKNVFDAKCNKVEIISKIEKVLFDKTLKKKLVFFDPSST